MKSNKSLFVIMSLLIILGISSCGGNNKSDDTISLPDPPTDIKYSGIQQIDGPFSDYIEVVPGNYVLELTKREDKFLLGYSGSIKVKFNFRKSLDVKAGTGYNHYGPSLLGEVLDDQGVPLSFDLDTRANKELATYLKRGSGEEWLTLSISGQGTCKDAEEAAKQLAMFQKGSKIRFNSEIVEEKFSSESSSMNSSGDCDQFLKGYEKYMKDYIAIIKKYKNNPYDDSIVAEYNALLSEASDWTSKTADCAEDEEFAADFAEIQMKIANAASEI